MTADHVTRCLVHSLHHELRPTPFAVALSSNGVVAAYHLSNDFQILGINLVITVRPGNFRVELREVISWGRSNSLAAQQSADTFRAELAQLKERLESCMANHTVVASPGFFGRWL